MDTEQPSQKNCIPPLFTQRNIHGLYEHLDYFYMPDGKVDWRKMIPSEHIVANSERTQETDVTKLEDKDLLILLEGFQQVADIRGFNRVKTTPVAGATENCVVAETEISWIGNYETQGREISRSGVADATLNNTKPIKGTFFLATIAENRSFVRAVRRFLKIPILGKDELGATSPEEAAADAGAKTEYHSSLDELLKNNKIAWENFKNKMIKMNVDGASEWEKINDVPEAQIFEVTENVKNALAEKRAQKEAAKKAAAKTE